MFLFPIPCPGAGTKVGCLNLLIVAFVLAIDLMQFLCLFLPIFKFRIG